MKRKYLFIALAMGALVSGQNIETNIKCSKKCLKYYQEDSKGNTMHKANCTAEVRLTDLDPCLFEKYGIAHPLYAELYLLREEVQLLRKIVNENREYHDLLKEAINSDEVNK